MCLGHTTNEETIDPASSCYDGSGELTARVVAIPAMEEAFMRYVRNCLVLGCRRLYHLVRAVAMAVAEEDMMAIVVRSYIMDLPYCKQFKIWAIAFGCQIERIYACLCVLYLRFQIYACLCVHALMQLWM